MRDDSLERKGSSENRNAIWKAYIWLKILQASKMKTKKQFKAGTDLGRAAPWAISVF